MKIESKTKSAIAFLVSAYFIYYLFTHTDWHFIDSVNLIIHEAGHSIFMFFGTFINILGGSLLQVLFPCFCFIYFFRREEYFSASLVLFWVGQSIVNVSVYASDALVMQLPLLGGDSVGHDWNNLLSMTGLLKYTDSIGSVIFTIGVATILCAIYFAFSNSFGEKSA